MVDLVQELLDLFDRRALCRQLGPPHGAVFLCSLRGTHPRSLTVNRDNQLIVTLCKAQREKPDGKRTQASQVKADNPSEGAAFLGHPALDR